MRASADKEFMMQRKIRLAGGLGLSLLAIVAAMMSVAAQERGGGQAARFSHAAGTAPIGLL